MIEVRCLTAGEPFRYAVIVREGHGQTRHEVTMSRADCERLKIGRHSPDQCIKAAFRFLLDRESKESILSRFDVSVISRYFPEFERELPGYLAKL